MNNFIANVFAELLSILHAIVLFGLGITTWVYYDKRELLGEIGMWEPGIFVLFIVSIFVAYVILFGMLSTFVAINQNLQKLVVRWELRDLNSKGL